MGSEMCIRDRGYTAEFKSEAVKLALNSPSVVSAAKSLGMPEATLHTWVQKAKSQGEVAGKINRKVGTPYVAYVNKVALCVLVPT